MEYGFRKQNEEAGNKGAVMEIKRCLQCGGNLKRVRTQNIWVCPYCEAVHHDETEEKENNAVNYFGLNHEVFEVKKDLSKIMKNRAGAGSAISPEAANCIRYLSPCRTNTSVRGVMYLALLCCIIVSF